MGLEGQAEPAIPDVFDPEGRAQGSPCILGIALRPGRELSRCRLFAEGAVTEWSRSG
jgi:hypothetical protein